MALQVTPSQTIGPFFSIGLTWDDGPFAVPEGTGGAFWIRGRVTDGDGEPVPDAVIETWQADPDGRYSHPDDPRADGGDFRGFARAPTDRDGTFAIHTVKPGPVPGAGGATQAPHLAMSVFARGLLNRVATRLYFDGDPANAEDPVLKMVDPARRSTLLARQDDKGWWRLPIHLGGPNETVFFDC